MPKLAIIPARGGSKRIPKKNIREFCGEPAITRTLKNLIQSKVFDDIVVSTDSDEIAQVAKSVAGVQTISRPSFLADDFTSTVRVISHAILEFQNKKSRISNSESLEVCCVYPINPFLDTKELETGLAILRTNPGVSYVNSIVSYSYPIQRALRLNPVGRIEMINPSLSLTRSQDLEETFHDAGQWYWGIDETWLAESPLLINSIGIQIPRWRALDIDTFEDWEMAEKMFRLNQLP